MAHSQKAYAKFQSRNTPSVLLIFFKKKQVTVAHDGEDPVMKMQDQGDDDTREYPCLIKVTNGKKDQFSTKVSFGALQVQSVQSTNHRSTLINCTFSMLPTVRS